MNFKTLTSEEQNDGIRMLKCYLASDRRGHFVTTSEAANMPGQVWGCVSYGCRLILHNGTHVDSPLVRARPSVSSCRYANELCAY